MSLLSLGSD